MLLRHYFDCRPLSTKSKLTPILPIITDQSKITTTKLLILWFTSHHHRSSCNSFHMVFVRCAYHQPCCYFRFVLNCIFCALCRYPFNAPPFEYLITPNLNAISLFLWEFLRAGSVSLCCARYGMRNPTKTRKTRTTSIKQHNETTPTNETKNSTKINRRNKFWF